MDNTNITQEGFAGIDDPNAVKQNEQLSLFELQELAVNKVRSLEQITKELKTAQEMLAETFKSNPEFQEKQAALFEPTSQMKEFKLLIARQSAVIELQNKVRELRSEAKTKKAEISDYALEVFRQTGTSEFEKDGDVYEIKTVAKLVKREQ